MESLKQFPPSIVYLILSFSSFQIGCSTGKNPRNQAKDTIALQRIFPLLEKEKVTAFRFQDWCKAISYSRGSFSNNTESNCFYILPIKPIKFDQAATVDIENLWTAVKATRSDVFGIYNLRVNHLGEIIYGEFDCSKGFVRQKYVFNPGYNLPIDIPEHSWYTKINKDWYYVVEDWN